MELEVLWREAVHGSATAWERLYQALGPRLYQFFLRNTRNVDVAMDKTQEVFEKLFQHRADFDHGKLKTWAFRIARNLLIDWWRKKSRLEIPTEVLPEIPDREDDLGSSVVERLARDELIRLVDACLEELSEDDRLVLGLVYLGGLSLPELAEAMEIPLGTAKTRARQARLRLDARMGLRSALKEVATTT